MPSDTDAVWVPGGNARLLLSTWRKTGTDEALLEAAKRGVVLSGRSAGANCWFSYALAAEPPRKTARFFSYRRNKGLGTVDTTLCTHYTDRREGFRNLLETFDCTGVGLGDATAFVVDGDQYSVVTSAEEAGGAYSAWISEETENLAERRLPSDGRFRPLSEALRPMSDPNSDRVDRGFCPPRLPAFGGIPATPRAQSHEDRRPKQVPGVDRPRDQAGCCQWRGPRGVAPCGT